MARAQTPPSDPQLVGIVVAANQIDIDAGKLALTKTHNKEVRDFAQEMVTDHTAVQKSVFDLGAKFVVLAVWRWRIYRRDAAPGAAYLAGALALVGALVVQGTMGGAMLFGS